MRKVVEYRRALTGATSVKKFGTYTNPLGFGNRKRTEKAFLRRLCGVAVHYGCLALAPSMIGSLGEIFAAVMP